MKSGTRVALSISCTIVSLAFWCLILSSFGPKTDLVAYAVCSIPWLLAVLAVWVSRPLRASIGGRILYAWCILIAATWSIELFGGIAWYISDKVARHLQKA